MKKGFALAMTLLFLLLLTLFGFSLLLIAGNYYASTRNLFEKENARIVCDQAVRVMIDRHNLDPATPRFFFDTRIWQQKQMAPFSLIQHDITASFTKLWSPTEANTLTTSARRGPYAATRRLQVRQRRLEDFALYLDGSQELGNDSLFDGPVFLRESLTLDVPGVVFRRTVQGLIQPPENATFRRKNLQVFPYPEAASFLGAGFFHQQALSSGIMIGAHNPLFWKDTRYEINLDLIQCEKQPRNKWRIRYNGVVLGTVAELILWFDDNLAVSQHTLPPPFLSKKSAAPLYIASAQDVLIETAIHAQEDGAYRYPIALAAEDALYIESAVPQAVCIEALLIALGSDVMGERESSLFITGGAEPMSEEEIAWFRANITTSAFLLEDQQKGRLLGALESGERIVWFRGGLVLARGWVLPDEYVHLHFQSSNDIYTLLPSFPFVYIVEGSEQWL